MTSKLKNIKAPPSKKVWSIEVLSSVVQSEDPGKVSNTVAAHLNIKISDKQMLLETKDINKLALNMISLLEINSAGETTNLN